MVYPFGSACSRAALNNSTLSRCTLKYSAASRARLRIKTQGRFADLAGTCNTNKPENNISNFRFRSSRVFLQGDPAH